MSNENSANSARPKRHFQQLRKDAPARIVDTNVDIKDLSRTETNPGLDHDQRQSHEVENKQQEPPSQPDSNIQPGSNIQSEDNIQQDGNVHYSQQKQSTQQKSELHKQHYSLQEDNIQQKLGIELPDDQNRGGKSFRVGRPLEKNEPDHKMMCYLPESLYETFKEGRLEEKFQNDRAFYVHIFASYFKGKPYDQYHSGRGDKKDKGKQKSKTKRG